jgi:hypothetical protein
VLSPLFGIEALAREPSTFGERDVPSVRAPERDDDERQPPAAGEALAATAKQPSSKPADRAAA